MAIPADVRADAELTLAEFCVAHSSPPGTDQPRYTYAVETNSALLIEQRPGFMRPDDLMSRPIAKFRYSQARGTWSLYWVDANERWHRVSGVEAKRDLRTLLEAVLTDSSGVFWS